MSRRSIPSVEKLRQALADVPLPRPVVLSVLRELVDEWRQEAVVVPSWMDAVAQARERLLSLAQSRLRTVINGTGIVLHTNLGRAPLSAAAVTAVNQTAARYCALELDLATGERGARAPYLERQLALLAGTEAATVVNNGASALFLIVRHLTGGSRKEVIISRGELVQIGGGFRVPEMIEASGGRLREVGTTNQTQLEDYRRALSSETALVLKVHRSNFFLDGFVQSPTTAALAEVARQAEVPLVEDLGSGAVVSVAGAHPEEHEPTLAECVRQGADWVCCSGDKLFGGPQAGLIVATRDRIRSIKRHPLFRALRCDKLVLAALEATADHYLSGADVPAPSGATAVPVAHLMAVSCDALRLRAERIVAAAEDPRSLLHLRVGAGEARWGGGTLPRSRKDSVVVGVRREGWSGAAAAAFFRREPTPILGYLAQEEVCLDLRTVFPDQDACVIAALGRMAQASA
jgi:L-seryl-tRNA(Ser) seleniumtransferase